MNLASRKSKRKQRNGQSKKSRERNRKLENRYQKNNNLVNKKLTPLLKNHKKERRERRRILKEKKNINKIQEKITSVFGVTNINKIAKATGFFKRTSKITPLSFLMVMVFGFFDNGGKSLILLSADMSIYFGIKVTAQALSDRLHNINSVKFLSKMLKLAIQLQIKRVFKNKYAELFPMFSGIKIEDSTNIGLNEKLAKPFKGAGGSGSKASMKVDVTYDLSKSSMDRLEIYSGSTPDQKLSKNVLKHLKFGELWIRDLGYFSIQVLKKFKDKGAYFLSRLQRGVYIYSNENDKCPIDISTLCQDLKEGEGLDRYVFIGKEKMPVRLIAARVPKDVLEKRKARYKKKKKCEPNEEFLIWSGFSIFITNITENMVSSYKLIMVLYKMRWQIELLFKSMKSTLEIDVMKGENENRIYCMIYAKLISVVLSSIFVSYATSICDENEELSQDKAIKWLHNGNAMGLAIIKNTIDLFLERLINDIDRLLCKNKRKRKTTYGEIVEELELYPENITREMCVA